MEREFQEVFPGVQVESDLAELLRALWSAESLSEPEEGSAPGVSSEPPVDS